jgi:probable F420-dependent oxidoreductase
MTMHIGVDIFLTDYSINPIELATELEQRGIESVWLPEHSHIPLSRESPWPGGSDLPKRYYDTLDPLVTLGAMAAVTTKLKLATGICLVVQRDPIHLAKETATIDQLSNGRLMLGVGGGWNAEEMADHGTEFKTRFNLMRENIEALKVIWTQSKPEYHGEFVDFPPMMQWPKPVQDPHPPIIVGGAFPHGARRAAAYGDGWIPLGARGWDVAATLPKFRQMVTDAGRNPQDVSVSVFGVPATTDDVARFRDAGVDRITLTLPSTDRETALRGLDKITAATAL